VTELFISAFVTLFVVIDPPGCAPIYAGTPGLARSMAVRAVLIASAILLVFALFGERLLGALHIELDSFRIAGGLMLFWIAFEMVFEKRTRRREERVEKLMAHNAATPEIEDVSVFPMAMPMLAGPGAIAAIMLLMNEASGLQQSLVVLAALGVVMALVMAGLVLAAPLIRLLGDKVEAVVTRLLGVLLAALAAQFVIDGLKGSFGL
jgi:multiple antibiotic resistance protein